MIYILKKYRPDLKLEFIDAYPTGLMIVRGLDKKNTTLIINYDQIISIFHTMEVSENVMNRNV